MILDTLKDNQIYFKSTLIQVLQEVRAEKNLPIGSSYKTVMRREKQKIPVYLNITRDPTNNWRMYTGKQIRKIVEYELKLKTKNGTEI